MPKEKELSNAQINKKTRLMTVGDTPWPFMLVCKAWHEIILFDTHPVVSLLCLDFQSTSSALSHLPSMLDVYLQRSKSLPLTLWIVGEFDLYEDDDINSLLSFLNLMERALSHQHRWEDVRLALFCFGGHRMANRLVTQTPANLTVDLKVATTLKRMDLHFIVPPKFLESQRQQLAIAQCNSLEELNLDGNVDISIPITINIADHVPAYLPKLHSLELSSKRQEMHGVYWAVLSASPNIVDLTLDFQYNTSDISVSPSVVTSTLIVETSQLFSPYKACRDIVPKSWTTCVCRR